MAVLNNKQLAFFDKLFYDVPELMRIVKELYFARQADAQNSADPTAKEAVARLEKVVSVMGYDNPEAWLDVAGETWANYKHSLIGKAMNRRYIKREIWTRTCVIENISDNTYFRWRKEFLIFAYITAIKKGLPI